MRKMTVRSILVAALLATGSLAGMTAQAQTAPKNSPALGETFKAAQDALTAKRYAEAATKSREALASGKASPDDVYIAHNFLAQVATAQGDSAGQIAAMEGMLDSGFAMGAPAQNTLRKELAKAYYRQKNFPQTIKYGTEFIRSGGGEEDVYTVVGQSYYQTKQYGDAVKLFEGLVGNAEKAGRKPDRRHLALLQDAYAKAGNAEVAQATLEKLVKYYPTPDTWLVLLYDVKKEKLDPRQKIHLFRLMDATGNLKHSVDLMDYSTAATALGLYEEAIKPLDIGVKSEAFKTPEEKGRVDRYMVSNRTRGETARADLPQLEADAKTAPTGMDFVALGMQQYNFGQYPKAVEAAKAGIAKGGLKNMADAQLTLGVAQLKAGQKGEAAQTFRAIKTDDAVTLRIAKLWALYASS